MFNATSCAISRLIVCLSLFPLLFAQEKAKKDRGADRPTIRTISESVVLDLVVRDKNGRPIRDLRADEIEVYENGVRQTLRSFHLVGEETVTASGPESIEAQGEEKSVPLQRKVEFDPFQHVNVVALVFERLPDTSRHMARQAAVHFLKTGMQKNTLAGVFAVDNRLWLLQHFTNDRELLMEAILRATSGAYGEFVSQSSATIEGESRDTSRQLLDDPLDQGVAGARSLAPSVAEVQEAALAEVTMNVLRQTQSIMRYQQGHASLASLLALVHEQGRLAGRKTLVLFSAGIEIPPDVVPRFRTLISEANRSNVSIYTVDARGLISEEEMGSAKYLFNQAVEASRRQQLTGLGRIVTREETMVAEWAETSIRLGKQGTLDDLARSTGGFLLANTNDPRSAMDRVSEDIRTYYEVAYTPVNLVYDGKFRSISVKIKRPAVQVQSRAGYFAVPPGDEAPILPYEIPMLVALNSGSLRYDFAHHSRVLRFGKDANAVQYLFVIEVPLATFSFVEDRENETYNTRFSLLTLLKNQDNQIIKKFTQDYPLRGPLGKMEMVRGGSVIFMRTFPLLPGSYTLESAVVDQLSERVSARRTRLLVRDPGSGLQMSSLSVIRRVDPLAEEDESNNPLQYQSGKIIPNLNGSIRQGEHTEIGLHCIIYPAEDSPESPELTLEILHNGQLLARGKPALSAGDRQGLIKFVGTVPIDGLSPGRYEVRAWVTQGGAAVKEHAFFSVASPLD